MTIYSDNAGNYFLGDCIWANHNISYPSVNFLQAHPHASISAELTALLTQAGLLFRSIPSQSLFNTDNSLFFCHFGASGDIDDRVCFVNAGGSTDSDILHVGFHTNAGALTDASSNPFSNTSSNRIYTIRYVPNGFAVPNFFDPTILTTTTRYLTWAGVADNNSLGLFVQYRDISNTTQTSFFWYSGKVADINTNFSYYNATIARQYISLHGSLTENVLNSLAGSHTVNDTTGKSLLQAGDAQYPIACADGQSPTAQWATDFYVFDNNVNIGTPAIGRVRNLMLAQGSYTIGKPVRIQGTVQPDNGFNCWLPVGTFAGKTVLMRCYSSVSL